MKIISEPLTRKLAALASEQQVLLLSVLLLETLVFTLVVEWNKIAKTGTS